jgi:3D (Asp-Asp-Asp) domain-containing protein
LPEIYGDKIFVVEDRMHSRKGYYHVDIWQSTYTEAKDFGAKRTYIEVLEN